MRYDVPDDRTFWSPKDQIPSRKSVRHFHGNCTAPAIVATGDVDLKYSVRCRTCPGCLRAKQYLWKLRAELEILLAPKTIFMTLTFGPQTWSRDVASDELTLFLKRYRKSVDYPVRYLAGFERHKSGAWHIHLLVHGPLEMSMEGLRSCWRRGFTHARVADVGGAYYISKYMTKDFDDGSADRPRVRASRNPRYGDAVMQHEAEVVEVLRSRATNDRETWEVNLRNVLKRSVRDTRKGDVWDEIARQTSRGLVEIDRDLMLDLQTGELIEK